MALPRAEIPVGFDSFKLQVLPYSGRIVAIEKEMRQCRIFDANSAELLGVIETQHAIQEFIELPDRRLLIGCADENSHIFELLCDQQNRKKNQEGHSIHHLRTIFKLMPHKVWADTHLLAFTEETDLIELSVASYDLAEFKKEFDVLIHPSCRSEEVCSTAVLNCNRLAIGYNNGTVDILQNKDNKIKRDMSFKLLKPLGKNITEMEIIQTDSGALFVYGRNAERKQCIDVVAPDMTFIRSCQDDSLPHDLCGNFVLAPDRKTVVGYTTNAKQSIFYFDSETLDSHLHYHEAPILGLAMSLQGELLIASNGKVLFDESKKRNVMFETLCAHLPRGVAMIAVNYGFFGNQTPLPSLQEVLNKKFIMQF
jgi:hypothetical protein